MYDYLLTGNNKKIYREHIRYYYYVVNQQIKKIKSSAKWNIDAQKGDFSEFTNLVEYYKLSTPDGKKLTEEEVKELLRLGMIGSYPVEDNNEKNNNSPIK